MHKFRELKIWQRSRELVAKCYLLTKKFPTDELYSLTSQIRRAAVSIPVNIAEGCGKNSDKDLMRYLDISNGSAFELETLIILANDLNYLSPEETEELIKEIQEIEKMIFNFKQKFKGPWHSLTIPHLKSHSKIFNL